MVLLRHYLVLVLVYGLAGSLLGVGAGIILKFTLPLLSGGLLEREALSGLAPADIVSGLILGLLVTLFFTFTALQAAGGKAKCNFQENGRETCPGSCLLPGNGVRSFSIGDFCYPAAGRCALWSLFYTWDRVAYSAGNVGNPFLYPPY